MKRILLLLILVFPYLAKSQGATCADMDPICTDVGANFTANTGTTAETGNAYGCLVSQPNPSWYYLEIATNGNIDMSLTAPSDIDFIIWGPFADLATAQATCGSMGVTPANEVDCSFSSTNTETPSIPNAIAGEVYVMLITNYANTVQDVTLVQTGGTGSTDCSIVTNPPCFMSYFEANIGVCDPATDNYSITGTIDFDDPPTTGDLVVQDCNGNQVVVASAPFTVDATGFGSETYTLSGLNSDGLACDVTAYFTADPTCSINIAYTAPICLCGFTLMSFNVLPCDNTTGLFDITGSVEFQSPPSTGTLTISDCNGNSQVFNAPFTSPQSFTFSGILPDGTTGCSITATFSDDPTCTVTSTVFDYPANCDCPVDAGSFTTSIVGNSTSPNYELCFGDQLIITPNGDFIPPNDIGDDGTFSYNPGMWLLLYECQPTVQAPGDFTADPCFLGGWDWSNPAGPWVLDNIYGDTTTYYFVPLTFYDWVNGIYSYFWSGANCFDLGPAYPVTFLPPIQTTTIEDCFTGTATITVGGGTPSFDGSNFTVVPGSLTPSNASFVNTSAPDGGTIVITGLLDGDAYSFDIQDDNGCPVTVTGTFVGLEDASFTYDFKYCIDDPNPAPIITGVPGGTFSSTAGLSINSSTGVINLAASTPGVYVITYQSPALSCWGTETFTVQINPLPNVVVTEDSPICNDGVSTITLNETGGDATEWLWTSSGGAIFDFDTIQSPTVSGAANGEVFTVTVTDVVTGCVNTANVAVTVNPMDNPAFTTTDFCVGSPNAATVTGLAGGTFSFNPLPGDGATINASTGEVSNGVSGTTYSIQYVTNGICPDSLVVPVTVNPLPNVTTSDVSICLGGSVNITASGAVNYTWSPATNLNTTVGATVTSTPTADISYTVTGTDANGCSNTAISNVTVFGNAPINAGPDVTICVGASVTLNASGGVSYTWDNGLGAGNGFTVSPTTTTTYTVTGTDANGCTGVDQITVFVNPLPTVNAGADQIICLGASVTLTATGATTYVWDNGVTNGVAFNPTATNTYTVTGTDANGCVNTDQVIVTVNPLPNVNAGPDQVICLGDPVTLTATGAGTYVWDNGVTNGVVFNPIVTTTYTVTGTDGNGCVNTDQVVVTVNPLPTVDAGLPQTICVGESVTLNGSGAVTYSWNNGVIDGVPFTPPVGTVTYTVTGTDANGCVNADDAIVTVNPLPNVNAGLDQIICVGDPVTLTATGATTYVWDNGVTNGVAFNPTATATYTVTGTDANGCVNTDQVIVTVNPLPNVNAGTDQVICTGDPVTLTATGAATYVWDNGVTNGVAFNPTATATYTVTGTDANGCVNTDQVIVTVNPLPNVNAGTDQTVCVGSTVTLAGSGATSYVWNNGVTDNIPFTPSVGSVTYTVTGTDANGCVNTDQVVVTVNPLPNVNAGTDQVICIGDPVTLIATGAVTYVWDNGVTNGVAFNPTATATYTVTGTDANGCVNTDQVIVTVNPLPNVNAGPDQVICVGDPVTLTASGAGTYVWDNGVTNGVAFNPTSTNTYTVTGTDANGCVNTDQVIVTVNPLPTVSAGADQTVCEGTVVTLTGSGAATYTWDNGVIDNTPFTPAVGTITYTVTGTDVNGCVNTDQVVVTVNPNPTPIINGATSYCTGTSSTLSTTVSYVSYLWSTGVTTPTADVTIADNPIFVTVTDANGCSADSPFFTVTENSVINYNSTVTICQGETAIIHGNPETVAGVYSQTYVLPTGCDSVANVTLIVNPLPNVNAGPDQILCIGESATLTGSGATSYVWDNSVMDGVPFTPSATITYTVTGTDANGCVNTDQVVVTVNPLPNVNAGPDQTVCEGTAVTLNGSGANTYVWNNGVTDGTPFTPIVGSSTYTVTGTDINGCVNTDQVNVTVNPLPAVNAGLDQTVCEGNSVVLAGSGATSYTWDNGVTDNTPFTPTVGSSTYTVTGTDINGCVNTDQVNVTVNPLPVIDAGLDQVICIGASVTLTGTGAGSGTYTWDNGVVDGLAFSPTATNTYTVTGTDANGCVNTDQVVVTVNPLPVIDAGLDQVICIGSSVTLTASGAGSGTYVWDNGVTNGVAFNPTATNTYTVTGTDANGCVNTDQVVVTVNPLPNIDAGLDQVICIGAPVTLTGTGAGTGTYVWDNGVTNGVAFNPTATNTYTVTGTDANGCVNTDQVDVTVNPLPNVNAGTDIVLCVGNSVTLNGSGAVTYVWDNGVIDGSPFIASVGTTTYTVTGTDANGCVNTDQVNVTINPLPNVVANSPQTVCDGTAVTLFGTGAVTYVWDNGVIDNAPFTPVVGTITYTVVGTDNNGCSNQDQVDVTVNSLPNIDAGLPQTVCEGEQVTLSGQGGSTYTWDNGVTNGVAFTPVVGSTTYTVTGTDANGCVNTDQVIVTVNALPNVVANSPQTVCDGAQVTLFGSGAATYIWDNGVTDNAPFTPAVGTVTYTVTGTDINGCVNTDQVDVIVNPNPVIDAGPDQTVCEGTVVTVSASGAVNYIWDNGVTDNVAFNPTVGIVTYTVIGTDANGCVGTDNLVVTVTPNPTVFAGNDLILCAGDQAILTGAGAVTYVWDNGVTDGVAFTPTSGIYTVTGTDANGCVGTDDLIITIEDLPIVSFDVVTSPCEPFLVTLTNTTVTTGNISNCVWQINNGAVITGCGPISYTFDNAGTYDVTLTTTTDNGCSASQTYVDIIHFEPTPIASFTPVNSSVSNLDAEVHFTNTSSNSSSYYWEFGDFSFSSSEENPVHTFPSDESGIYTIMLVATSSVGCVDTTYGTVQVEEELIYYVPNTFTPDDDSYNPTFKPVFTSGFDPLDYELLIFNRWGEIVFESHNAEFGWDGSYAGSGKIAQDGTYTWVITFKTKATDERKKIVGHVNIIR